MRAIEEVYDSQDPYHGGNYREFLDFWTRKARIYVGGFDLELVVAATFKTHAFREAYTAEYARAYKLNRVETDKLLQDQIHAARMYNDIVISAFMPDKRWNDFHEKDTIWKVYLISDDTVRVKPLEVRRLKNVDAVLTHFFPYISPWDVVYLVRFPASAGTGEPVYSAKTKSVKLVITSVRGSAELAWDRVQ